MKLKELKRVLALSMAFTLAVPANVYAADVQVQTEDNTEMESEPLLLEDTQENTEEPENPVVPRSSRKCRKPRSSRKCRKHQKLRKR